MDELIMFKDKNRFNYRDIMTGDLFNEFVQTKKYWIPMTSDEIKTDKTFQHLLKQILLLNRFPKIERIVNIEEFRRSYEVYHYLTNPPPLRLIERYSMPTNYIELIKESKYDDEVRDRLLYYVSHNENTMIEIFNSKFDLFGMAESFKSIENRDSFSLEKEIDKFQYFKQQSYSSEFKITRMLKYPLTFRKCICMISVFVWINECNPLEVFIFSEPQLTLLTEPCVMANKSVFNNKYSYRQVIDELK